MVGSLLNYRSDPPRRCGPVFAAPGGNTGLEAELAQAIEDAREARSTWGEIGISMGLGSRSGARHWVRSVRGGPGA
jgi:hypothetical protein